MQTNFTGVKNGGESRTSAPAGRYFVVAHPCGSPDCTAPK
jgi:hypothetical protein